MKLLDNELIEIYDYCSTKSNFIKLLSFINKLLDYTFSNEKIKFTKQELEVWNKIPIIHSKSELNFPLKIYRGLVLSKEIINKTIVKFKTGEKIKIKPFKNQFQSFSTDKNIAEKFSFNSSNDGLIFQCELIKQNKFIDVILFYHFCQNMINVETKNLGFEKQQEYLKILDLLMDYGTDYFYNEKEVIVFDKLEVENVTTY